MENRKLLFHPHRSYISRTRSLRYFLSFNSYLVALTLCQRFAKTCRVQPVPVPGTRGIRTRARYRWVDGYTGMGLRRAGQFFFGKNPLYPYPCPYPRTRTLVPAYPHPRTRVPVVRFMNRYNDLLNR
jgi:hypothetical protein